tara:strand:- start:5229 stop:6239 length:1011 start_codon:yes stop_codon:yes gene_type:complete
MIKKEVCIFGYAEETRNLVFELPDSVEVWGINMAHMFLGDKRKAQRWLQIHPRDWSSQGQPATGYWGRPRAHFEFLQRFEGKIIMSYDEPDLPQSELFPFEKFRKKYGREYFTNSFSYLMAMAIDEGYGRIYLYGINLTALDEYIHQRPCMEYWIGQAEARGIDVIIPPASALVKANTSYGLKSTDPSEDLANHVAERLDKARQKYTEAMFNYNTAASQLLEIRHWDEFLGDLLKVSVNEFNDIKMSKAAREKIGALAKKIQQTAGARFDKRRAAFNKLQERAQNEINTASGRVQSEQHYLSVMGGVDYRAGALPEMYYPNPVLATDFDPPEQQAV